MSSRRSRPNAESRAALPAEGKPFRFARPVSWLWVHPWTRLPAFAVALWVLVTLHSCGAAPELHRLPIDRVSRNLDDTGNHVKRVNELPRTSGQNFRETQGGQSQQIRGRNRGSSPECFAPRSPRGEPLLDSDFFFWESRKRLLVGEGSR